MCINCLFFQCVNSYSPGRTPQHGHDTELHGSADDSEHRRRPSRGFPNPSCPEKKERFLVFPDKKWR